MDRLTSLTVFVSVAESGGFSSAARHLNMSTTMVSNHIRSLEDRLRARLLNRTTRKVSLTEVGRGYYERCRQILSEIEEADTAVSALQSMPRGTLRLYTGTHLMRFVAPVVAEYLGLYPDVSMELAIGEHMIDLVEEGFDLAIRPLPLPDSSLIVRRLATWRHVLCCSPAYLDGHAVPRRPADLVLHNCLCYTYYPFAEGWRFDGPGGKVVSVRVSGNLLSSSAETLRVLALRGQGVFLAPGFVIGEDLEAGRLVPIMTDYRPVELPISAIYPHRRHLSVKVRGFIDLLAHRIVGQKRWLQPDVAAPAAPLPPPAPG